MHVTRRGLGEDDSYFHLLKSWIFISFVSALTLLAASTLEQKLMESLCRHETVYGLEIVYCCLICLTFFRVYGVYKKSPIFISSSTFIKPQCNFLASLTWTKNKIECAAQIFFLEVSIGFIPHGNICMACSIINSSLWSVRHIGKLPKWLLVRCNVSVSVHT